MKNKIILESSNFHDGDTFAKMIYKGEKIEIRIISSRFYGLIIGARNCSITLNKVISEIGIKLGITKAEPKDPNQEYDINETLVHYNDLEKHFAIIEGSKVR